MQKCLDCSNKTHAKTASFTDALQELRTQIISRGELPHVSVARQLDLLDQLCQFPFGRYLIERKGANGFWTDYLITYPNKGEAIGFDENGNRQTEAEEFILNRSLLVLAHRDRFQIYQSFMQKHLKEGVSLASVPCGLMKDLLTLDFSSISNFQLVGLDIDPESISLAQSYSEQIGLSNHVSMCEQDAWKMDLKEQFNIITSSGLNVYESDPVKVVALYQKFFDALKPGGYLVISVLTYPPGEEKPTDWDLAKIPPEDLLMEKILYKDVLNLHWRNFRSIEELDVEFKQVGFTEIQVSFDRYRLFPTIIARKPL
jgi:SAM-dependent methyltransferase